MATKKKQKPKPPRDCGDLEENRRTVALAFTSIDEAFSEVSMISAEMRTLLARLDVQKQKIWDAKKLLGMTKIRNEAA